jgi:phenylacetate-coenzyme A ligase PaaK-like adenylate-forming protein
MSYCDVIMNPFYNPFFLLKILNSYLRDINRLDRFSEEQLHCYQDKQIRNMVKYAFSVPLYQSIYKKHGITPNDISNRFDIQKLPVITKDHFKHLTPQDLVPRGKDPNSFVKISTSGTTGKSLGIYVDMYEIILGLFGYLRTIRSYGLDWRKNKLSIIGDFAPHTAESGYVKRGLLPKSWFQSSLTTIQWLDTNDPPEQILKSLESFQPDFIGGYTGMLGHIAVLKNKGMKSTIRPKLIASTGALLDLKLKQYIEQTFSTTVFEVYGATETGPIAYQPPKSNIYRVMSDFLVVEFHDENDKPVPTKKPGKLVVTKLYHGGTPIIRYDALNDIVSPKYGENNKNNLFAEEIQRIYGRDTIRLYRKDGKILLGSSLTTIFSRLLYQLETSKIRELKVIQQDLEHIDVNYVVDEKLRNEGTSVQRICEELATGFKEVFGSSVHVNFTEVSSVSRDEPRIITRVDPQSIKLTGFA